MFESNRPFLTHQFAWMASIFDFISWANTKGITYKCDRNVQIKSFIVLAEAEEFWGSISESLRPGNTAAFFEMSQWWRAVGNTLSNLTGSRFEPQTSRSRDERLSVTLKTIHKEYFALFEILLNQIWALRFRITLFMAFLIEFYCKHSESFNLFLCQRHHQSFALKQRKSIRRLSFGSVWWIFKKTNPIYTVLMGSKA